MQLKYSQERLQRAKRVKYSQGRRGEGGGSGDISKLYRKGGKECDNERGERGCYFLCWNQEMKQRGAVITPPQYLVSLNSIWGLGLS